MDYFLAGSSALRLIRTIRIGACDLALAPTDVKSVKPIEQGYLTVQSLGIPELCNLLGISPTNKLHLLVPSSAERKRASCIKTSVRSASIGNKPFLEVVTNSRGQRSGYLPQQGRVFVENPASIVLSMACKLTKKERKGFLTHQRAVLMLTKFCLELCGTFSLDPVYPNYGEATFFLEPVLTVDELRLLDLCGNRQTGLRLLREVIPLLFERSASPGESFVGCALFGDTQLGGLQLGEYKTNKSFDLSDAQRRVLTFDKLTPDFYMPAYKIAIEHNGQIHEQGDNPQRDVRRMNGYTALSCKAFVITRFETRSLAEFNKCARQIVSAIEAFEGPAVRNRFENLIRDKGFCERQSVLYDVYRHQLEF